MPGVDPAEGALSLERLSVVPGRVRWRVHSLRDAARRCRYVEERVAVLGSVSIALANPLTGRLLVLFDPHHASIDELEAVIAEVLAEPIPPGVAVVEPTNRAAVHEHEHEHGEESLAGHVFRLVVGGITLGAMVIHKLFFAHVLVAGPALIGAGIAVTIVAGYPFLRGAVRSLTHASPAETDTLITVATVASVLLREAVTALLVLWLLNLGELLQAIVLRRTRRAIRDLLSVGETEVWVIVEGTELRVPIADVKPGDLVAVYTGEKIPVDGLVETGEATVNEAPITGESLPVFRNPGDGVYAGTLVEAGWARIRAERVGDDTAVGRLIRRVEEARELKAPIQTVGEVFSQRFVPASFALAGLVFLLTRDIRRSVTMLVVACPCAAGLATPTAISASIGNAARRGVLIKGGVPLQAASGIDTVVFDKTGTLTTGRPRVATVISCDPDTKPAQILALAASGELHSPHPLALAVVRHVTESELVIPEHEECEFLVGRGMRADMQHNRLLVGSQRLMEEFGVPVPNETQTEVDELRQQGQSVLYVGVNENFVGLIGVADNLRPEAEDMLAALRSAGIARIVMLTGDSREAAEAVARRLGLSEFEAELLPEDKLTVVRRLQAEGHRVAVVGDGINDAPALAAADVGIAVGTQGSDVAIEAADVAVAANDIRHLATVIGQSQQTLNVVKQNYGLALGVNSLGIGVSALGALNPVLAALLHNLSTIAVVLNSSRLIGYRPENLT